jgi:hypothetical protein
LSNDHEGRSTGLRDDFNADKMKRPRLGLWECNRVEEKREQYLLMTAKVRHGVGMPSVGEVWMSLKYVVIQERLQ